MIKSNRNRLFYKYFIILLTIHIQFIELLKYTNMLYKNYGQL